MRPREATTFPLPVEPWGRDLILGMCLDAPPSGVTDVDELGRQSDSSRAPSWAPRRFISYPPDALERARGHPLPRCPRALSLPTELLGLDACDGRLRLNRLAGAAARVARGWSRPIARPPRCVSIGLRPLDRLGVVERPAEPLDELRGRVAGTEVH